jgi:hypothetical protein
MQCSVIKSVWRREREKERGRVEGGWRVLEEWRVSEVVERLKSEVQIE